MNTHLRFTTIPTALKPETITSIKKSATNGFEHVAGLPLGCPFRFFKKKIPKKTIESVKRLCWDAELIWLAILRDEIFVAFEPAGEADKAIAQRLSLHLARRSSRPELSWRVIARNLDEEN